MRTYDEYCDDQEKQERDFGDETEPKPIVELDPLDPFFTAPLPW